MASIGAACTSGAPDSSPKSATQVPDFRLPGFFAAVGFLPFAGLPVVFFAFFVPLLLMAVLR
jgi:hypothetical protein